MNMNGWAKFGMAVGAVVVANIACAAAAGTWNMVKNAATAAREQQESIDAAKKAAN